MIGRHWLAGPAMPSQVDRDYTLGPWEPIMEIPVGSVRLLEISSILPVSIPWGPARDDPQNRPGLARCVTGLRGGAKCVGSARNGERALDCSRNGGIATLPRWPFLASVQVGDKPSK
jgi:hypothetical protein